MWEDDGEKHAFERRVSERTALREAFESCKKSRTVKAGSRWGGKSLEVARRIAPHTAQLGRPRPSGRSTAACHILGQTSRLRVPDLHTHLLPFDTQRPPTCTIACSFSLRASSLSSSSSAMGTSRRSVYKKIRTARNAVGDSLAWPRLTTRCRRQPLYTRPAGGLAIVAAAAVEWDADADDGDVGEEEEEEQEPLACDAGCSCSWSS